MGFLKVLTEFFESIFKGSSPEYAKKQELKRCEAELKLIEPAIYKNNMILPNFAELFRIMYENTRVLYTLLSSTICSGDTLHNKKYEEALLETGFSPQGQELLEKLSVENRKNEVMSSDLTMNKVLEAQKKEFGKILKEVDSDEFRKIDTVIAGIRQLYDLCCFDFVEMIQLFDPDYSGKDFSYKPSYQQILLETAGSLLQDYYYITATFKVNTSIGRALTAISQIRHGYEDEQASRKILDALKKVNTIHTKFLNPELIRKFIILWKKDSSFEIKHNTYSSDASKSYAAVLQTRFSSDENRVKMEIKDRNVAVEQQKLFGGEPLEEVHGFNAETNNILRTSTSYSFSLITPMQILKTFIVRFFTPQVQSLLEDIVIEGFFNNSTLKSDFSSRLFTAKDFAGDLEAFEKSFDRGGDNDVALIKGYIEDSHKDADFIRKLSAMVENINKQAMAIIQNQVTGFRDLYLRVSEMLVDSKKSKSDLIVNIKVLLSSSRNRDATQFLEQTIPLWPTFFEIMKNYAIIGEIDKK